MKKTPLRRASSFPGSPVPPQGFDMSPRPHVAEKIRGCNPEISAPALCFPLLDYKRYYPAFCNNTGITVKRQQIPLLLANALLQMKIALMSNAMLFFGSARGYATRAQLLLLTACPYTPMVGAPLEAETPPATSLEASRTDARRDGLTRSPAHRGLIAFSYRSSFCQFHSPTRGAAQLWGPWWLRGKRGRYRISGLSSR